MNLSYLLTIVLPIILSLFIGTATADSRSGPISQLLSSMPEVKGIDGYSVIKQIGPPTEKRELQAKSQAVWVYPDGDLLLENGLVILASLRDETINRKLKLDFSTKAAEPEKVAQPENTQEDNRLKEIFGAISKGAGQSKSAGSPEPSAEMPAEKPPTPFVLPEGARPLHAPPQTLGKTTTEEEEE